MKAVFVLEVDEQDDVDRLATFLISHPLINSVTHVPEKSLREMLNVEIQESYNDVGHPQAVDPVGYAVDGIIEKLFGDAQST